MFTVVTAFVYTSHAPGQQRSGNSRDQIPSTEIDVKLVMSMEALPGVNVMDVKSGVPNLGWSHSDPH
jgi:hypothetical protein